MKKRLVGKLILFLGIIWFLGPISGSVKPPEIIEVDYSEELVTWEATLDSVLGQLELIDEDIVSQKKTIKEIETTKYKFSWPYHSYKLPVQLFGSQGQLLARQREEIKALFKDRFSVVNSTWEAKEKQRLTIELGFKPQNNREVTIFELEFIQPKPEAKLAVIIDDLGFNRAGTEKLMEFERPLTMALLPQRPYTELDLELAKEAGHEVILHQPLEPLNSKADPGAGAIYTGMASAEIKKILRNNLDSMPEVVGINNHMGSKATADPQVMEAIMEVLEQRDIFYFDSSTVSHSVADDLARLHNVPTTANHLFIDNEDNQEVIEDLILDLGEVALEKEELAVIGHVRKNTARALENTIPKLESKGIKLVPISELVD